MKKDKFAWLLLSSLLLGACSKNDKGTVAPGPIKPKDSIFVLTAAKSPLVPVDYIYTSNTLDSGTLVTTGTGIEQDGTYHNYIVNNGSFFSLLFGQTSAGAVTAYKADSSRKLNVASTFQTESMTAYTNVGDEILLVKNAWQPEEQFTKWYRVNAKSFQIVGQGEIDAVALTGKGEKAFFTGLKKVGNKVFAAFWPVQSGKTFATAYSQDSAYIAVYSYPDMKLEKVITDNRTGGIGAYYTNCLETDENGDAYAIGTKLNWNTTGGYSTTTPVAFLKIKSGSTEFDKSYFFDLTAASEGQYVFKQLYMGKGYFLLTMIPKPFVYATVFYGSFLGGIRFAVANVYNKSFKWVTGTPDAANITSTSEYAPTYSPLDGTGYMPIYYKSGSASKSSIFKFNGSTATAKEGLTTDGKAAFTSIAKIPAGN